MPKAVLYKRKTVVKREKRRRQRSAARKWKAQENAAAANATASKSSSSKENAAPSANERATAETTKNAPGNKNDVDLRKPRAPSTPRSPMSISSSKSSSPMVDDKKKTNEQVMENDEKLRRWRFRDELKEMLQETLSLMKDEI